MKATTTTNYGTIICPLANNDAVCDTQSRRHLERRFSHVVNEIEVLECYKGREELQICRDARRNNSLVVKKIGLNEWEERVEREASMYRMLNNFADAPHYILPMIAAWRIAGKRSCLVTPFMPLGSLGEAIADRKIDISVAIVVEWLEQATRALNWLHQRANCVHVDTKTDNFMLAAPDRIILFDFDECWASSDFVGAGAEHNYRMLQRYDHVNFLRDLQRDLINQRDICTCYAEEEEEEECDDGDDDECDQEQIFAECAKLVGNYSRSHLFAKHSHERAALRGSLIGTVEESEFLLEEEQQQQHLTDDDDKSERKSLLQQTKKEEKEQQQRSSIFSETLKRLRLRLAEENEVLHLKMRNGTELMI